jgi:hypothetical protein
VIGERWLVIRAGSVPRASSGPFTCHLSPLQARSATCYFPSAQRFLLMASAQFPDEQSETGEFERQEDAFRDWVTPDGSSGYPAVAGRYHLYVSWACPWAHRTIIVRRLKQLEKLVGMTVGPFAKGQAIPLIRSTDLNFLVTPTRRPNPGIRGE